MKTLIPVIVEELSAGRPVALATVLQSNGSAPRGSGACQLLCADGRDVGTVGGGLLERRALDELHTLLATPGFSQPPAAASQEKNAEADGSLYAEATALPPGSSYAQEYALTQNEVRSLGMVCGGNVTLLYQRLAPSLLVFFREALSRLAEPRPLWLVRRLTHGEVTAMALTDGSAEHPVAEPADRASLYARKPVWAAASGPLRQAVLADADSWFLEPICLPGHAYLFGGGHVSQRVAPLLAQLDFSPVIYDDRPEFTDPALFPTAASVVCAPFGEALDRLRITAEDEIVIMTRGHVNDLTILTQALRTPAYYIGLIGSRSKIEHTRSMLLSQGFTDADFARVHTPVGLPIKAETPMEIAVSVAAEMILCRAEHEER